ncbi:hypothetical protein [Neorhizobium sp. T6_25]|uniref:hypothetical protein n=1 Tax=Neorhizobium sp. T6_25 TaxID=2093833 RepID=UPI000CF94570|nr:hypothetical protein [Neorhizobium sp. T6_25]
MTELTIDKLWEILPIISGVVAVFATAITIMTAVLISRRSSYYNDALKKVELSAVRSSLEAEIARLNRELVFTNERFQEVNHLVLSGQRRVGVNRSAKQPTPFLEQFGITEQDLEVDDKLIFVLTPFASEESEVFRAIADACREEGFLAVRGDEQKVQGDILTHVIKQICKAKLIVANVGSRNPNVFYELGLAQALGKQTLLVAQHESHVPFDLQSMRVVFFDNPGELHKLLPNVMLRVMAG